MTTKLENIVKKMLLESGEIRNREKISCATAADILHSYAIEISEQIKYFRDNEGKMPAENNF